jgi:GYF domain 2
MSSPLQVTVVRAGNEVGTYELAEVLRLLGAGTLKPTDFYWHEGMGGWELLSKLDASDGLRLPT